MAALTIVIHELVGDDQAVGSTDADVAELAADAQAAGAGAGVGLVEPVAA